MLRACAEVAAKHGLVAEGIGLQAMDLALELRVRCARVDPAARWLDAGSGANAVRGAFRRIWPLA